jgi:hypothetical protein
MHVSLVQIVASPLYPNERYLRRVTPRSGFRGRMHSWEQPPRICLSYLGAFFLGNAPNMKEASWGMAEGHLGIWREARKLRDNTTC